MEQDKITVKMNYCINPLMAQHLHLGGEFSLKPGQTEEQGWAEHIGRIERFFKDNFPQQNGSNSIPARLPKDVVEPIDKIQSWKQVISMCTSIVALERFKVRVEEINDEGLTEAYNSKLKQLQ